MANPGFHTAVTDTKMTAKPIVVAKPIWFCNSTVFTHHFLTGIINKTSG
jgi:hypothetical protein